jgi:hypothetical protein
MPGTRGPVPVRKLLRFLETGEHEGLFARDVTSDINFPHQRFLERTADALVASRRREHPGATEVHVERLDRTERGWVIQLEERWERGGERWYSREIFRADVADGRIVELAVYCTGDWDEARQREHAENVTLARP